MKAGDENKWVCELSELSMITVLLVSLRARYRVFDSAVNHGNAHTLVETVALDAQIKALVDRESELENLVMGIN